MGCTCYDKASSMNLAMMKICTLSFLTHIISAVIRSTHIQTVKTAEAALTVSHVHNINTDPLTNQV